MVLKIFNLVHCLQAAEALRQNLLNKESLVLHKRIEMWAMDSASLYSGESIITEDATQDRGKKKKTERKRGRDRHRPEIQWREKKERDRQWAEKRCWCLQRCRLAFAMLSLWGDAGRLSSGEVEANQHFGGDLMASNNNMDLKKEAWIFSFFLLIASETSVCVWVWCVAIRNSSQKYNYMGEIPGLNITAHVHWGPKE